MSSISQYNKDETVIKNFYGTKIKPGARFYFEKNYESWRDMDYNRLKKSVRDYFKYEEFEDRHIVADWVLRSLIFNPEGSELD